jgi:hypothetical protein
LSNKYGYNESHQEHVSVLNPESSISACDFGQMARPIEAGLFIQDVPALEQYGFVPDSSFEPRDMGPYDAKERRSTEPLNPTVVLSRGQLVVVIRRLVHVPAIPDPHGHRPAKPGLKVLTEFEFVVFDEDAQVIAQYFRYVGLKARCHHACSVGRGLIAVTFGTETDAHTFVEDVASRTRRSFLLPVANNNALAVPHVQVWSKCVSQRLYVGFLRGTKDLPNHMTRQILAVTDLETASNYNPNQSQSWPFELTNLSLKHTPHINTHGISVDEVSMPTLHLKGSQSLLSKHVLVIASVAYSGTETYLNDGQSKESGGRTDIRFFLMNGFIPKQVGTTHKIVNSGPVGNELPLPSRSDIIYEFGLVPTPPKSVIDGAELNSFNTWRNAAATTGFLGMGSAPSFGWRSRLPVLEQSFGEAQLAMLEPPLNTGITKGDLTTEIQREVNTLHVSNAVELGNGVGARWIVGWSESIHCSLSIGPILELAPKFLTKLENLPRPPTDDPPKSDPFPLESIDSYYSVGVYRVAYRRVLEITVNGLVSESPNGTIDGILLKVGSVARWLGTEADPTRASRPICNRAATALYRLKQPVGDIKFIEQYPGFDYGIHSSPPFVIAIDNSHILVDSRLPVNPTASAMCREWSSGMATMDSSIAITRFTNLVRGRNWELNSIVADSAGIGNAVAYSSAYQPTFRVSALGALKLSSHVQELAQRAAALSGLSFSLNSGFSSQQLSDAYKMWKLYEMEQAPYLLNVPTAVRDLMHGMFTDACVSFLDFRGLTLPFWRKDSSTPVVSPTGLQGDGSSSTGFCFDRWPVFESLLSVWPLFWKGQTGIPITAPPGITNPAAIPVNFHDIVHAVMLNLEKQYLGGIEEFIRLCICYLEPEDIVTRLGVGSFGEDQFAKELASLPRAELRRRLIRVSSEPTVEILK